VIYLTPCFCHNRARISRRRGRYLAILARQANTQKVTVQLHVPTVPLVPTPPLKAARPATAVTRDPTKAIPDKWPACLAHRVHSWPICGLEYAHHAPSVPSPMYPGHRTAVSVLQARTKLGQARLNAHLVLPARYCVALTT